VVGAQCFGGNTTDIIAGNFGSLLEPAYYFINDTAGGTFGITCWCTRPQASGNNTFMEFFALERFGVPMSPVLYYVRLYVPTLVHSYSAPAAKATTSLM
tara:strand:+ start:459 stop:755 length:297 start_codon:yes stop_codon:yes gene_type:complete